MKKAQSTLPTYLLATRTAFVISSFQALRDQLVLPQHVVITMHRDPDADAMGSSLAWAYFLKRQGHTVTVISPTDFSRNLRWMYGADQVLVYEGKNPEPKQCREALDSAQLICCLDFSSLNRLKDLGELVRKATAPKLLIDHHLEPEAFATFEIWDTGAAATAQLVYHLVHWWDPTTLDTTMAELLYAGIMTDTGSFRHGNTTAAVHLAVAELMQTGFDANRVHRRIFDEAPLSKLKLLGHTLAHKLTVLPSLRTAYMVLTAEELKQFDSSVGDTDGLVNYGLQVEGVVMSVLFTERSGEIRMSFRSVGDFSVRELAAAHFGGGGHRNASGGRSTRSLHDTVQYFLQILPRYEAALQATQ